MGVEINGTRPTARPALAPIRRTLFLRRGPVASLAPLYVALLALAALTVAVFVVALWPLDTEGSPRPAIEGKPAAEAESPPPAPLPRSRSVWM